MDRPSIIALTVLAGLAAGCSALESDEAKEVAQATRQTVARGIDGAADVADQAATRTQQQLDRVDVEKVRGAWDAVVSSLDRPSPSESTGSERTGAEPTPDPLADAATAIACDRTPPTTADEPHERCTVTADFARRARQHGDRVARQVRVSPAKGEVRGIRIDAIEAGTLGALVGLRAGDVVTHINGMALGSIQDAMLLYASVRSARRFVVHYRRGAEERSLEVEVI